MAAFSSLIAATRLDLSVVVRLALSPITTWMALHSVATHGQVTDLLLQAHDVAP